ncbi:MAG: hypothetical protein NWT02_00180 [Opitutales bacterium]|nr:hypothetical protein [Opitutales bacterium]
MTDKALTKNGLAWLVSRFLGCLFAVMALKKLGMVAYAAYLLNSDRYLSMKGSLSSRISWDVSWPQALIFVVYAGLAFYLLRHGSKFVALICNEGHMPVGKEETGSEGIAAWIAKDESRRYLSKEVQRREYLASQQKR